MNKYEKELQALKSWDDVQCSRIYEDLLFIETAGHGYYAIPTDHPHFAIASKICSYGFKGKLAVYLEEDCEISEFKRATA